MFRSGSELGGTRYQGWTVREESEGVGEGEREGWGERARARVVIAWRSVSLPEVEV